MLAIVEAHPGRDNVQLPCLILKTGMFPADPLGKIKASFSCGGVFIVLFLETDLVSVCSR